MSTLFGKIIRGELPCDKVFENERILVFRDIHPKGPIHFLIVPKKEIANFQDVKPADWPVVTEMLQVAQQLAEEYGIAQTGYRLLTNCRGDGGQEVQHLHFHLIGGKRLGAMA
jgi:histidine triad (HIT) family protein